MRKTHFAVQIAISAACLVVVAAMVRPAEIWETFGRARPAAITGVFLLMPLAILARAWRWRFILGQKAVNVPLLVMFRVVFIASALNLLLPASMGDLASSYYGWRSQGNKEAMLASAMADKMTGLLTLCLMGIVCAAVIGHWQLALLTLALTVPLAVIVVFPRIIPWRWATLLFRKLFRKEMSTEQLHEVSRLGMKTIAGGVAISVIGWMFTNLMYYFACLAFTCDVSVGYVFAVAPLINLMRILPVTVSGLGSADMLIVFLFGLAGISGTDAFAASLVVNVGLLVTPGLIGLAFIVSERGRRSDASTEH